MQKTMRPKCGRLVGFESGDYHGVLPITAGRRCALAIWYTFNPNFQELAHAEAETLLRSLEGQSLK
jgi:predicted 2-oxoglutarate/Fe(II)-dependent dioxygenase YbiX